MKKIIITNTDYNEEAKCLVEAVFLYEIPPKTAKPNNNAVSIVNERTEEELIDLKNGKLIEESVSITVDEPEDAKKILLRMYRQNQKKIKDKENKPNLTGHYYDENWST